MHLSWFCTLFLFAGYVSSEQNQKVTPENPEYSTPYISTVIYFDPKELDQPEAKILLNDQNVKNVYVNSIIKK